MNQRRRRRLGATILAAILLTAFFALSVSAGIATSPLGVRGRTPLAGLGSCPLGSHAAINLE